MYIIYRTFYQRISMCMFEDNLRFWGPMYTFTCYGLIDVVYEETLSWTYVHIIQLENEISKHRYNLYSITDM